MGTPRNHRLTRRQSDALLDGLGGPDDLTRLLADARPLRAHGELPGEAAAVAAFRGAAVDALAPQPRSSSVRTLSLSRSVAAKVLAVATASVAVGGVAVAATGHLPGSGQRTTPTAASTTAHPTARPSVVEGGGTPADADGNQARPSGPPTAKPTRRADDVHAIGLCRAWAETTRNDAAAVDRSPRFRELSTKAGGGPKVAAYCAGVTSTWCENHRWPGATTVQVEGRPIVMRCIKPTGRPSGAPSAIPTPSGPHLTIQPTHPAAPGNGKPSPLPSGGPVRT